MVIKIISSCLKSNDILIESKLCTQSFLGRRPLMKGRRLYFIIDIFYLKWNRSFLIHFWNVNGSFHSRSLVKFWHQTTNPLHSPLILYKHHPQTSLHTILSLFFLQVYFTNTWSSWFPVSQTTSPLNVWFVSHTTTSPPLHWSALPGGSIFDTPIFSATAKLLVSLPTSS